MSKLIPESERKNPGIKGVSELSASVRCSKTSLRIPVIMSEDEAAAGTYSGVCNLNRGDVRSHMEIDVRLTRSADAPKGTNISLARRKRGILATSPSVRLHVDSDSGGSELIHYKFVNFEKHLDGKLSHLKSEIIWIDLTNNERIVCYVNTLSSDWPPIIESKYGKNTKRGRVREYMNRSLVAQVLGAAYPDAFYYYAGLNLNWDDIEHQDGWRRYALEELSKVATKKGSKQDRAAWIDGHLQSLQGEDAGPSALLSELGVLIQRQLGIRSAGEKLARILIDYAI